MVMPTSLACSASWAHRTSLDRGSSVCVLCVLIPGTRSAPDTPHSLGPHPWDCCNLLERFSEPAGRSLAAKKQLPACEPGPRGEGQVRSVVCPGIPLCPLGCHMLPQHMYLTRRDPSTRPLRTLAGCGCHGQPLWGLVLTGHLMAHRGGNKTPCSGVGCSVGVR